MKTSLFLVVVIFTFSNHVYSQSALVDEGHHFTIHNNYWVNLHHFLYQSAKESQKEHLTRNGDTFLQIREKEVYARLNANEKNKLSIVIAYYRENIIQKPLIGMMDVAEQLQKQNSYIVKPDSVFSKEYANILNQASLVFRSRFWPLYEVHNRRIWNRHRQIIHDIEIPVFNKLEQLTGDSWPDRKLRIDLTSYANWAGAYTNTDEMKSFISTLDPYAETSYFIEIIMHESSHRLFMRNSPLRAEIYDTAQELDMEFPGYLWHAVQFYLVGQSIKYKLKKLGIDHTLIMDLKNIYSTTADSTFRMTLDQYYRGEIDRKLAVKLILLNLE